MSAMQCTMMSGVQCLRAPSTVALKQSTCSPFVRLQASSLTSNPLRSQQACRQINVNRGSHTAVRAAAADGATFYDYAVKVRTTTLSSSTTHATYSFALFCTQLIFLLASRCSDASAGHRRQGHSDEEIQGESCAGSQRCKPMWFYQAIPGGGYWNILAILSNVKNIVRVTWFCTCHRS